MDHGVMNGFSAAIGGIPLCHGAGGMAGHVRFGARTGGALVILEKNPFLVLEDPDHVFAVVGTEVYKGGSDSPLT